MHLKVPCKIIIENQWLNLQFDIKSFILYGFQKIDLLHIDSIAISGNMLLRKILITRFQLPDSFPHFITQRYGDQAANEFELNISRIKLNNIMHEYYIEELGPGLNYEEDFGYMN